MQSVWTVQLSQRVRAPLMYVMSLCSLGNMRWVFPLQFAWSNHVVSCIGVFSGCGGLCSAIFFLFFCGYCVAGVWGSCVGVVVGCYVEGVECVLLGLFEAGCRVYAGV